MNPEKGIRESARDDILLFVTSTVDSLDVTKECLDLLNDDIGCSFADHFCASEVLGDIKKAEKAKLSTLIPAFVYIDRKNKSSYITTTYIKILACTVMGYLTCQKKSAFLKWRNTIIISLNALKRLKNISLKRLISNRSETIVRKVSRLLSHWQLKLTRLR